MQQLDKNMSNLRSWLCRVEAELSRPISYSVCHHQEIQRRLAEQQVGRKHLANIRPLWPLTCVRMSVQELQRDIQQHTEGVESVLSLCDTLLRDEDAAGAGAAELEGDSLQETSRSLDQRWRTICTLALDRRLRWGQQITIQPLGAGGEFRSSLGLKARAVTSSSTCLLGRIEETWRLWCKFLDDYSQFEDWLKTAERAAANPNSADVLYTVAKEELKRFEVGLNDPR